VVYGTLIRNPTKPGRQRALREVAKTATKPPPAPFQKHSLGGCTINMPPSNCHRRGIAYVAARYLVTLSSQ